MPIMMPSRLYMVNYKKFYDMSVQYNTVFQYINDMAYIYRLPLDILKRQSYKLPRMGGVSPGTRLNQASAP